jgi:hypothetical protein
MTQRPPSRHLLCRRERRSELDAEPWFPPRPSFKRLSHLPKAFLRSRSERATSKGFVSGEKGRDSQHLVFVGEDGEEDAVSSAHGAGSAADLAEAAFDGYAILISPTQSGACSPVALLHRLEAVGALRLVAVR